MIDDIYFFAFTHTCFFTIDPFFINAIVSNITKDETDTAQLSVTASGINNGSFMYEWSKMSSDLPSKVLSRNQKVLIIPDLLESDEGFYLCKVTNTWNRSKMSDRIHLVVQGEHKTKNKLLIF